MYREYTYYNSVVDLCGKIRVFKLHLHGISVCLEPFQELLIKTNSNVWILGSMDVSIYQSWYKDLGIAQFGNERVWKFVLSPVFFQVLAVSYHTNLFLQKQYKHFRRLPKQASRLHFSKITTRLSQIFILVGKHFQFM